MTPSKIALLLLITLNTALASEPVGYNTEQRLERCSSALYACSALVQEQDQAILNLKAHVTALQSQLADAPPPTLPTWGAVLIGISAGILLGVAISQ